MERNHNNGSEYCHTVGICVWLEESRQTRHAFSLSGRVGVAMSCCCRLPFALGFNREIMMAHWVGWRCGVSVPGKSCTWPALTMAALVWLSGRALLWPLPIVGESHSPATLFHYSKTFIVLSIFLFYPLMKGQRVVRLYRLR